ncbi:Dual specificity protein phosphatase 12 [Trichostrongylus colubriformis]|uniref:protein-tyrosine-phosphatase n=1 Tax=Trichostrongylus colubriformis TaxID=6319 RepID=A0AAN8FVC4_TRICO
MIDRILDHVFMSGARDVLAGYPLQKNDITHVLTISAVAVPMEQRLPKIDYHFLFAMDMPSQDLLGGGQIAEGIAYITRAVQSGGNVLVHCEVGVSRSATIVAAYVMQKLKYSAEKAVEFIKKSRPSVCPNQGFFTQLQIFESLHYQIDDASLCGSRMYKNWCVSSGNVPNNGAEPQASAYIREVNSDDCSKERGNKYRCGKCRHTLFFGEHLMKHKRIDGEVCKFGYLIEPMKWMNVSEYEGKICCPKCDSKLGNYTWGGRQCQGDPGAKCMQHVSPWVHLHRAKVDEVTSQSPIERLQSPHQHIPAVIIS